MNVCGYGMCVVIIIIEVSKTKNKKSYNSSFNDWKKTNTYTRIYLITKCNRDKKFLFTIPILLNNKLKPHILNFLISTYLF